MPPVFGICNTKLKRPDPEMIGRMNSAAKYIKPREVKACEPAGGYLAAAVDLENPLVSGDGVMAIQGNLAIVADASLYKRKELLHRMGRGGDAKTGGNDDALLILEAWRKWGEECVRYLYGDFAFVIFNLETGAIFCGRDALGVRPFFYAYEQDVFVFGSELRYVLAFFKEKPVLRKEYLLETLVTVKSAKELTPFEKIYRLKPGHCLECSGKSVNLYQYWQADPENTIRFSGEAEYIALFREKLVDAVKIRCSGVAELGSELSGGLDSSAVTGIAANFSVTENRHFVAFSNIFPTETGIEFKDEREFISSKLTFKPVEWIGIDRLNHTIPELFQHTINIQGCFIQQNFNIFNRGIYEAAGEQGIQVLLSGFGGDELVSARITTPWNEIISERQWKVLAEELFYKGISFKAILKTGILAARYLKSLVYHPQYRTGVFTPELLNRRFASLPLQSAFAASNALKRKHERKYRRTWRKKTTWRQYDQIMLDHLPQRMEYCYTAAAQHGLEYRYPLLDLDLVETCLAFPPWVKQHCGTNRYTFRQVIKGYVPEKIRQRNDKSGNTIPQTYYSLVNERDEIFNLISSCSGSEFLNEIFDFSGLPEWYERLVKRDKKDINFLMPGAFYDYLMILLYYKNIQ